MNLRPMTIALATIGLTACTQMGTARTSGAVAELRPTQGSQAAGTVGFTQVGSKVQMSATVSGLTAGLHGFHIHEKGDCSAPDAASAGGHFNPHGKPHGGHSGSERHAGDMGNLAAGADGVARASADMDGITLGGGAGDIIGRSVVVHADPDDLKSQPAGNSGKRIACGVIVAR